MTEDKLPKPKLAALIQALHSMRERAVAMEWWDQVKDLERTIIVREGEL